MIAAFDIGSTNMRYAAGTANGELETEIHSEKTRAKALSKQLSEKVEELEEEVGKHIDTVSVSTTGLIDTEKRVIKRFDTEDGGHIENIGLGEKLGDRRIFVENDANAGALGEYHFGMEKENTNMLRVTIGTGIGGGIVEKGEILVGFHHNGGEVGHIIVDKDGELSQEGVPGSWEAYCSGRGIPEFARNLYPSMNISGAEGIFEKAENGERKAEEVLEKIHEFNAKAMGTLANIVAPESIIIGGTVALENEEIVENIEERIENYCYVEKPEIRKTEFEHAEIYGALTLPKRTKR